MKKCLYILLLLLGALPGFSQVVNTWTGNADANWNNPANWSLAEVPTACQDVVIPVLTDKPYPMLNADIYVKNIQLREGVKLFTNNHNIFMGFGSNFTVAATDTAVNCTPTWPITLKAAITGIDSSLYTYVWRGPDGVPVTSTEESEVIDTLLVNTPRLAGISKDSATTVIFFKPGFAVNSGANYTARISNASKRSTKLLVSAPGDYILTVTENSTGCSVSDTASVTQTGGFEVAISGINTLTCVVDSLTLGVTTTETGLSYSWTGPGISTPLTTVTINATQPGNYSVTVGSSGGCSSTATAQITQNIAAPQATLAGGMVSCNVSGPLVLTPSGVSPSGVTYEWSGPGISSGQNPVTATLEAFAPGTYEVTITDPANGCSVVKQATVTLNPECPGIAECPALRVKAIDQNNNETTRIPRDNGVLQSLTLTGVDLSTGDTWGTGGTFSWILPDNSLSTSASLAASQMGDYYLTITKDGITCNTSVTLRAAPCRAAQTEYSCNPNPTIQTVPDVPGNYLQNLAPGDTIYAGDFIAIVLEVAGGTPDGGWTGKAQVKVPYMAGADVFSEFTNAKINSCYELITGSKIETVYDASENGIVDIDDITTALKDFFQQLDPFLENYKGTPAEILTLQNTLLPLLEPYEDMPEVAALQQKLENLAAACEGNATSTECQQALNDVKASYEALQELVEDLPPFPDYLLTGILPPPGGRIATEGIPTVKKLTLDGYADNCGTPICKAQDTTYVVQRYYGRIFNGSDEFWLVKEGGKKYYIWRGYNLNEEIYGYCLVGGKQYTIFYPERGESAGEAFSNAASQFVFDVGVTVITGGFGAGGTVTEAVLTDIAGAVISAMEESNGDGDKFVSALQTELIFTTLSLSPEGISAVKKLYKKFAPNFPSVLTGAPKWNLDPAWFANMKLRASQLTDAVRTRFNRFLTRNAESALTSARNAIISYGGRIKPKLSSFYDNDGALLAKYAKQGDDYILEPASGAWTTDGSFAVVRRIACKYKNAAGNIVDGILELVDGGCPTGGRLNVVTATGPCKLFFRLPVFTQFRIADLATMFPTISKTTYISLKHAFRFDPPRPPAVDRIRNLITTIKNNGGDPGGTITEDIADLMFHGKEGFFRQNGKIGSDNGFDGLFIKPAIDFTKPIDEIDIEGIIINESKQIDGGFRMNDEAGPLPRQMTMDWVGNVIGRMLESKDPAQKKLAEILEREFNQNRGKFTRVVTGVDQISETIGIVKLN